MKRLCRLLMICCSLLTLVPCRAAEPLLPGDAVGGIMLAGTVRDTSQNILPGVAVKVAGATVATVTDAKGEFSLKSAVTGAGQLLFSKTGYIDKKVPFPSSGEKMNVDLAPSSNDAGLLRYTVPISLSHVVGQIGQKDKTLLKRKLTDDLYRELVARFGEAPAEDAVFRVYLPPGIQTIQGLFLISEHGVGGPMMEHRMLRDFADRQQMALIGVLGNPIQRGIYPASTLDAILVDIGAKVNHPEMATAPVFTFGHSNGTGFSAAYAAMRPDRVVGWISFHSGGEWHLLFPGVEDVPGLTMHGQKDKFFKGQAEAVKTLRSERSAPVSILIDGESDHWPRNREHTFALILSFCESCIRARFADGVLRNGGKLQPVAIEAGWLAERYDTAAGGMQKLAIARYAEFPGDRKSANWLPDETFARAWQRYAATGSPAE